MTNSNVVSCANDEKRLFGRAVTAVDSKCRTFNEVNEEKELGRGPAIELTNIEPEIKSMEDRAYLESQNFQ